MAGNENEMGNSDIIQVQKTTLDDFCKTHNIPNIDILKIDTEGHEREVLIGAKRSLSKTRYLLIEINTSDYSFSEINSLLYSDKYNFQLIYFRNFSGKGFGTLEVGDFLYHNENFDS